MGIIFTALLTASSAYASRQSETTMLALPLIMFQAEEAAPDSWDRAGCPITAAAAQAASAPLTCWPAYFSAQGPQGQSYSHCVYPALTMVSGTWAAINTCFLNQGDVRDW